MTKIVAAGYAIVGETAIYGTGRTRQAAWDDAKEWVDRAGEAENWTDGLECCPATKDLIEEVELRSGAISWGTVGDIVCTREEEDDESE